MKNCADCIHYDLSLLSDECRNCFNTEDNLNFVERSTAILDYWMPLYNDILKDLEKMDKLIKQYCKEEK